MKKIFLLVLTAALSIAFCAYKIVDRSATEVLQQLGIAETLPRAMSGRV